MNQKELKELIDFLIARDISEFELERGDLKVRIKRRPDQPVVPVIQPVPIVSAVPPPVHAASAAAAPPAAAPAEEEGVHIVKSPIVGTFYEAPSPGAPAFVKPGDAVQAGQVLCIIEAMKLMNEIECDVNGEIIKRLVNNNQPVEYGQPLFAVRPIK